MNLKKNSAINKVICFEKYLVVGGKFIQYKLDLFTRLFLLQGTRYTC